jgi:hypothetical protein
MDTKVSRTLKFQRMLAAYKLRLARKAAQLGAQAETWGLDEEISVEVEQRRLRAEDKYRIAPYPYPGLRSFDPEEGEIFFGRKRNIEEVRALLVEHRMVAVLGGSGSGKSSLLRAGLLPFLNTDRRIPGRNGNWYNAEFRPRARREVVRAEISSRSASTRAIRTCSSPLRGTEASSSGTWGKRNPLTWPAQAASLIKSLSATMATLSPPQVMTG